MNWSEQIIARALAIQIFNRRNLVVVPNCSWPGSECDVLVVTENLRVIDVEIKISRADFRADAKKEKWWQRRDNWGFTSARGGFALHGAPAPDLPRAWPRRVWKHYYCLPAEVWKDDMLAMMPSQHSGVLLIHDRDGQLVIRVKKPAKPDRNAEKISPEQAVDIARLASLRMWDAILKLDQTTRAAA